jgi:hypothetical protein
MSGPDPAGDWLEFNQHQLVAHFHRLRARLAQPARAGQPPAPDMAQALPARVEARDVLLLCAGVEMDAELARCCSLARPGHERGGVSFGLALGALEAAHWTALAPLGPLRRWRLLDVDDSAGIVAGRLRIDERILHYLAGLNYLDQRLQPLLRRAARAEVLAASHREAVAAILAALQQAPTSLVVLLAGDDLSGRAEVAAEVAHQLGLVLHVVAAAELPQSPAELEAFALLWQREAVLLGSALLVEAQDPAQGSRSLARLVETLTGPVFVGCRQPPALERPTLRVDVERPGAAEQRQLWVRALGPSAERLNGALAAVASQFRLSARTIFSLAPALCHGLAQSADPDALLWNTCRRLGQSRLDELAQRLEPAASFDELVLPAPQKAALRQIIAHTRQRLTVYGDWGFALKSTRGLGITALFAGDSGTGKTMAAEVLARALQLDLYRIDLSAVVSKYIGESEKNLRRVFDAAEDSGAILLFDEADALFGKRSEVKDSHDRYANIEVSYLLQRMEAYRGLAILTTNLKSALDTAFQRRLRFVVQFPFPAREERRLIWQNVFPAAAPLQTLDHERLARLNVSGGQIKNIALGAAFLAADAGERVGMAHLLKAARSEAAKREAPLSEAETRGWV